LINDWNGYKRIGRKGKERMNLQMKGFGRDAEEEIQTCMSVGDQEEKIKGIF